MPNLRPIGYRWHSDCVHGATIYRSTWEVTSYVEQRDGSFTEQIERVRFEKLPRADVEDDHGGS